MTERLYYDQSYLRAFSGCVLRCEPMEEGKDPAWRVLLDQTAFYPTSGGQPYDTGTLGGANVTDVEVESGEVWHTVDRPLKPGTMVEGSIDWPRRWDHMQQHAGDHMIASALHRLCHGTTIGLHIGQDVSTIDVDMPEGVTHLSDEQIREIEWDVNERIQRDVPIRCWFPSEEELAVLPLRKPPTVREHVRIVAIGTDEMVACGGTHPSSAGQIGLVKIVSAAPARGLMRVAFLAGGRAYADYQRTYAAVHEAAERFSTNVESLNASIDSMQQRLKAVEHENAQLHHRLTEMSAEDLLARAELLPDGSRLIAFIAEEHGKELAQRLIEEDGLIALIGTPNENGSIQYVFGRSKDVAQPMGQLLKSAATLTGGRGGGRPDFAQGNGTEALLDAAARLVREAAEGRA